MKKCALITEPHTTLTLTFEQSAVINYYTDTDIMCVKFTFTAIHFSDCLVLDEECESM